ncbi:MAG: hypothetical protein AAGA34_03580 [Pseudomonadota bacterium]
MRWLKASNGVRGLTWSAWALALALGSAFLLAFLWRVGLLVFL